MPRKIQFYTHLLAITLCASTFVHVQAEEVFVNDSLRVGVRPEPTNNVAPISVVTTGMSLTVLEREGDYIKIKTDKGVEGWIKNTYVSAEPPAIITLEKLRAEYKTKAEQLSAKTNALKAVELNVSKLEAEISHLKKSNAELQVQIEEMRSVTENSSAQYFWKALITIVLLVIGFIVGVIWHRSQAMKRLGGLRV